MPAMAANPAPHDQDVVVNPVIAADSHPVPKKRKDDNWRLWRAMKSAQNKASKAIAARDKKAQALKDKLNEALLGFKSSDLSV
mgnify:CR=1 FL=1